jgi:hypothetical protein
VIRRRAKNLDTGHYPMLSQPAELVDLLVHER